VARKRGAPDKDPARSETDRSEHLDIKGVAAKVANAGAAAGRLIGSARMLRPGEREAARVRRLRRRNRQALPNLYDVHPDVRLAARRELGLLTIPVAEIRGTAVEGPAQRRGDFLPLPQLRTRNWEARWQRLRAAQDRLAILPPVDLLQAGDGYWVVDGHNRVGLALYNGQPEIDASIVELVPPGGRRTEPVIDLAPTLAGSRTLRTRGEGRAASEALAHEDRLADPGEHE